jgi:serine/threonine-protein kinase
MYMSPEQIKGESPDRRSDIYSLGVTLFEMVSGRPPFKADSAMTLMMMHINDPVPDPKKLNPDVPDELVAIINKALAKSPGDRYQSAAEMASALRKLLAQLAASAEAPAPAATMIEEMPNPYMSQDATSLEPAPASSAGTVVESAPQPAAETSRKDERLEGTAIETPTESLPEPSAATWQRSDEGPGTVVESPPPGPVPVPPAPVREAAPKKPALSMPVIAGIGVGLACLIFGGIFLVNRMLSGGAAPPTEPPVVAAVESTETATATEAQVVVAIPTETIAFTETPTETPPPSATPTPDKPYVVITGIRVQGDFYAVDYEVHNFPEDANLHVHMFFDTVPPEQAGSPGVGPWKLTWGSYGDPPFTQYGIANRPADASQMCALVANPNHSVQLDSGNCVDLP